MSSEHGQSVIADLLGDRLLASLDGEHDLTTVHDLRDKLRAIFRTGTTVVIDLTAATFIDSSTLGGLIKADRYAQEHDCEQVGIVVAEDPPPGRLFGLVGAHRVLTTFPSADEAFAYFESADSSSCPGAAAPR